MPLLRLLLAFLALGAGSCGHARAPATYVMRHLDTLTGMRDPDLTVQGRRNAERLSEWFQGKRLAAIYVSGYQRTRQTVAPLAARLGLSPKLYDPRVTPALMAAIRQEKGPVLIVGHSNTVPDIVEQLGGTRPAPLGHRNFGDIWIVEDGKTERVDLTG